MKQLCVVHISMLALAAGLPLGAALAQQPAAPRPVAPRTPAPATTQQVAPQAEGQLPAAQAEPLAPLPPPPPPLWRPDQARSLLNYIYGVGREGLNPYDYEPDGLLAALSSGDPAVLAKEATDRFNKLSSDLALGHVRGEARIGWHVVDKDLDEARQRALLVSALNENRIPDVLNGLLPMHPQYASLRAALQATPRSEVKKVNKIRLNMDRWRWLPRDLGQKYIIVNVPAFHATLVENGVTRWKHRAIAGAIKTPTPQLSVMATGVILNPWWEVPPSITKEVAGKPGYVALKGKDGKIQRWRQPPGPNNALGQLKFVMYNPYNIYLHDTNARSRFNATSAGRALSHGCVRTEHVLDLATELLGDDGGEWTPEKIKEALGSKNAKQANFVKPVPVHIVYFSVAALNDGTIVNYTDVYKRDDQVIAALLDGSGKAPGTPARKVATN